jgi:hypothetical protein
MLARNVHMYYDPDDEQNLLGGKVNIMYAAEDGHLIAKFYVRYKMDEDFERDVELLHRKGIRAVLRTYDPNIREEMIEKISFVGRLGVRTVRKTAAQLGDFAEQRQNSGIVSRGSSRNIVSTVLLCRRAAKLIRMLATVGCAVSAFGALLMLVLAICGVLPILTSLWFGLYQALACLPIFVTTIFYIGK